MKTLQQLREAFHRTFGGWIYMDPASVWSWFEPHLSTPGTTEGEITIGGMTLDERLTHLKKAEVEYFNKSNDNQYPKAQQRVYRDFSNQFHARWHELEMIKLSPSKQIGEVSEEEAKRRYEAADTYLTDNPIKAGRIKKALQIAAGLSLSKLTKTQE